MGVEIIRVRALTESSDSLGKQGTVVAMAWRQWQAIALSHAESRQDKRWRERASKQRRPKKSRGLKEGQEPIGIKDVKLWAGKDEMGMTRY